MTQISLALIIVTYSDRRHLVDQVISEAQLNSQIREIVVIDNDSLNPLPAFNRMPADASSAAPRIHVIHAGRNSGSAGGYNLALQWLINHSTCDYYVLVDDDLLLSRATIERLMGVISAHGEYAVFVIPRDDRPEQIAILSGARAAKHRTNSFHDFDLASLIRVKRNKSQIPSHSVGLIHVDHAPYGGMVIPRSVASSAELPDKEFFVYCDDYDYTMKIIATGASVLLIDIPPLHSVDKSWNQKSGIAPAMFRYNAPAFRIYYSVRNRVAYEKRYIVRSNSVYYANMAAYILIGAVVSLFEQGIDRTFFRRLKLIGRAIADGLSGRLGQAPASRIRT